MSLSSWLRRFQPRFDVLEDRCLPSYTPIDLGHITPYAINNAGQVVGVSVMPDSSRASLWDNGILSDLGTLGGANAVASDISDTGLVAGRSDTTTEARHAFLWQTGIMTDLGITLSYASLPAVNNAGVVVGSMETVAGVRAFVWENGVAIDLADLLPAGSGWTDLTASDVNDHGQIVGSGTLNGASRAFLYRDIDGDGKFSTGGGQIVSLGTLGGFSEAAVINDGGQVAGRSRTSQGEIHAFRWTPVSPNGSSGTLKDLGRLAGNVSAGDFAISQASDLNDAGDVVGESTTALRATRRAVLSTGGAKVKDLNGQLPSGSAWQLDWAGGINNAGWIVGGGSQGGVGSSFLLIPGTVTTPLLSVNDTYLLEGDPGTNPQFTFVVTLSKASTQAVTVEYATVDDSATVGSDYTAVSGTLTFAPGETSKTITVQEFGDLLPEPNESFRMLLSNPSNALLADSQGVGTINDDEPRAVIADVTVTEGNAGTTRAVFMVTLTRTSTQTVTVDFTTRDGGATAGSDYVATAGTLTFAPGENRKTLTVLVNGDTVKEADETFVVELSNEVNVYLPDRSATGTILNDDRGGGKALRATAIASNPITHVVTSAEAQDLVGEALSRWQAVGVDTSTLGGIRIHIANLGGDTLGVVRGHTIWLDDNAAGWGWFVDPTPADDREFTTPGNQGEQGRMDLLTVLLHEAGHRLGFEHSADGVMAEALAPGSRRVPSSSAGVAVLDQVFADGNASFAAEPLHHDLRSGQKQREGKVKV